MFKTILFDLDGTLVDSGLDLANALNAVRSEYNKPALPYSAIRPTVSLGGNAMVNLAFGLKEGQENFEIIREKFLDYYSNNIANDTCLFDGMEEILKKIESDNRNWGIVTNKSTWLTEPLLKALDLENRVACVVCGDTLTKRKPDPEPILHACKLAKSKPDGTIYIGDAARDIEAGRRAGTKTMVALYGYIDKDDDPYSWNADSMVEDPKDIYERILELE